MVRSINAGRSSGQGWLTCGLIFLMVLVSGLQVASVYAADPTDDPVGRFFALFTLPNFHVVKPFLLRGGQPDERAIFKLKEAGVKTIVDLRNEPMMVKEEAAQARAAGISFVNIPLEVFNSPSEDSVKQFIKLIDDRDRGPFYVHCLHGQDRTGTMIGIYRIERDGWGADQAYSEMLSCGFRPEFVGLSRSVFAHGARAGRPGTPPSGGDLVLDLQRRFQRHQN